ncbi:hypothetical protein PRVXT_002852 [Proteinivorax tanatarense]|uniref:AMP-activated protein kinase glycogen-binding domain-containing protein n=1 Tax=Proteinivorax tanatarense TaxID=1260629 RepID=A0AAU7VL67_9FIRM
MNVQLDYSSDYIKINKISIIGELSKYAPENGEMSKKGDNWTLAIDLPPGEYKYRFLVNDNLSINDPKANIYAPDEEDKLWSVLVINNDKKRLYNNQQYSVHLQSYGVSSVLTKEEINKSKKEYNAYLDEKIVTRFEFTNITGIHVVTVAWYNPVGELFQYDENNLFKGDKDEVRLWFWLDLKSKRNEIVPGSWKMKLFVNGAFVLEDKFTILKENSYSYLAKQKQRL